MTKYIINTTEAAEEFLTWLETQEYTLDGFDKITVGNELFIIEGPAKFTIGNFFKANHKRKPLIEIYEEMDKINKQPIDFEIIAPIAQTQEPIAQNAQTNPYENKLIFGKDQTEEVVAVENVDNEVWLFLNNGEIIKKDHTFWTLTSKPLAISERLEGNLHFKHINKYPSKKEYQGSKAIFYQKKIDFYAVQDQAEAAMIYDGITLFKGLKISDVSVLSFDIETSGVVKNDNSKVYLISNTYRDTKGKITKKLFSVDAYDDDSADMIEDWSKWVQEVNPTVITGHNIIGFDFPYMSFCYKMKFSDDISLGRDLSEMTYDRKAKKFRKDGSQEYEYFDIHIFGRQIIDTFFLAIKYDFQRNYPNYKLKDIVEFEGLVKKGRTFYDAGTIRNNWKNIEEREKIKKYAIDDADDSLSLYDLMAPNFFYYTQSIPRSFQRINNTATGSQINSFLVRSYLQESHSIPKASERADYGGGVSFGIPGVHKNTLGIDAKSMYPSIMIQYSVCDKKKDPKQNFLEMVKYFTYERFDLKDKFKKTGDRYFKDREQSGKIIINSSYGLLGATGLNFNSPKNADFVTSTGREIIKFSIKWATGKDLDYWHKIEDNSIKEVTYNIENEKCHNYLISHVDTDGISFKQEDGKKFTQEEVEKLIEEVNSLLPEHIIFEEDGMFKTVLVIKAKNYVKESYKKKDPLVIKGSALKASMKSPALQQFIKDIINALLKGKKDHILHIYNYYIQEILSDEFDIKKWATKKTITESVLNPKRTNEQVILDAIEGKNFQEGDKCYIYYTNNPDNPVRCVEDYNNDHDVKRLFKGLYNTLKIFETVLDIDLVPNYDLKRNLELLNY